MKYIAKKFTYISDLAHYLTEEEIVPKDIISILRAGDTIELLYVKWDDDEWEN